MTRRELNKAVFWPAMIVATVLLIGIFWTQSAQ